MLEILSFITGRKIVYLLHFDSEVTRTIEGLVDYTSNGAGSIKLKIKNIRKQLNTKENPVILEVKELDIEGPADQVIKLYKTIVEE